MASACRGFVGTISPIGRCGVPYLTTSVLRILNSVQFLEGIQNLIFEFVFED